MASQLLGIKTRFTNDLGSPLVGGQVYTYFAGTSTNQDTYSDAALTVPNTNPVILDDTGSADIFLKGAYRIRVFDKSGRFIEEQDNVTQAASQGDATELSNKVSAVESDLVTANTELSKVKLDTGITATAKYGGVERTQAEKNSDYTTLMDFGGKCDGVTDDSNALQRYVDSGLKAINIPNVSLISKQININNSDLIIKTTGKGIICGGGISFILFNCDGDNTVIDVDVDGNNTADGVVVSTGDNITIENCNIKNLSHLAGGYVTAIQVTGDVLARISNNTIEGLNSASNGIIGDGFGACKAIQIYHTAHRTKVAYINNNIIKDVRGEEGDAISVMVREVGVFPYYTSNVKVVDNFILNCNRRAIKVQASNTIVTGNMHINTLTPVEAPLASDSISILYCKSCTVKDNTIISLESFSGISLNGESEANPLSSCVVTGNKILLGNNAYADISSIAQQVGIYSKFIEGCEIESNLIRGGHYNIITNIAKSCSVSNNKIYANGNIDSSSVSAIYFQGNNTGNRVVGNVLHESKDRNIFIGGSLKSSLIKDNIVTEGAATTVRLVLASTKNIYTSNYNLGTGAALSWGGDVTNIQDSFVGEHKSISAASLIPSIGFSRGVDPSTTPSAMYATLGDFMFNTAAKNPVGWKCTTGGLGSVAKWQAITSA